MLHRPLSDNLDIEPTWPKRSFRPHDLAMELALGLGAGYAAGELLDLYVRRGCEVFPPLGGLRAWVRDKRHYARYLYDREALKRLLTDKLGDRLFGDSKLRLCIPAFEGRHSEVFVFKTPHDKVLVEEPNRLAGRRRGEADDERIEIK